MDKSFLAIVFLAIFVEAAYGIEKLNFDKLNDLATTNSTAKAQLKAKTTHLPIALEPITVIADPKNVSLTDISFEESKRKLNLVPGGTSLIDGLRIKEGAVFTVNDALAYAPGVYVGDSQAGVAAGSRISIRGSDINSQFIPISGLKILRNGMPLTRADGTTDTEDLNLNSIEHIEVYRGANALEYGGSNLGGAINLITPTGYSAYPFKVGLTMGTDGYVKPMVSSGRVLGKGWDVFGAFSYLNYDGNIDNTDQELTYGYGNIGYRWSNQNETRLHVEVQAQNFHINGGLTKDQLEENPRQTNIRRDDPRTKTPMQRIDLQHTLQLDSGTQLDLGAYYMRKDNRYLFQDFGFLYDFTQNVGFSWRHQLNSEWFGLKNRLVWGGLTQWQWNDDKDFQPITASTGVIRLHERDSDTNTELYLQDQLSLSEKFTLVMGGQINYRKSEIERLFPTIELGLMNPSDHDSFNFNPKLGFVWQYKPTIQFYGNVSRSSQPPRFNDLMNFYQISSLTSQTGTTLELGTRGGDALFKWDLAIYQTWLNQELLTVRIPPNFTNFSISNAKSTEHTGIELGLESMLPLNWLSQGDQLRCRGSYTWSRFQFDNDPSLGNNYLPGIPQHNGRFEVLYQHPSGLYIGPNVTTISRNWVDFANTTYADSYTLLGARLGWDDGKHWKVFVDGRNLTNEHYAASVHVTGDAQEPDPFGRQAIFFNSGGTVMVFGGFEFSY